MRAKVLAVQAMLLGGLMMMTGCGMSLYPGQPGLVTNNFSKIDMENLDDVGLWVYEVSYDNTKGGKGVGAIVTKLYRNAQSYTSNVRTNADGSLYRHKSQYDGAEVQMISLPTINQVMLPPKSEVQFFLEYDTSMDEVDDRNVAEEKMFGPKTSPTRAMLDSIRFRWELLKAAKLDRAGSLSYDVADLELGTEKFVPSQAVQVQTNLSQNGVQSSFNAKLQKELVQFVEAKFPKGYTGVAKINLKGVTKPISLKVGLHTIKTAEAAGIKIVRADEKEMQETLKRYRLAQDAQ